MVEYVINPNVSIGEMRGNCSMRVIHGLKCATTMGARIAPRGKTIPLDRRELAGMSASYLRNYLCVFGVPMTVSSAYASILEELHENGQPDIIVMSDNYITGPGIDSQTGGYSPRKFVEWLEKEGAPVEVELLFRNKVSPQADIAMWKLNVDYDRVLKFAEPYLKGIHDQFEAHLGRV